MSTASCYIKAQLCTVYSLLLLSTHSASWDLALDALHANMACMLDLRSARMLLPTWQYLSPPGRRSAKLISVIVSAFTASFVQSWSDFFPHQPLQSLPTFDGRTVCYPTDAILRDYLSWRQADTHINNQVCPTTSSSHSVHL